MKESGAKNVRFTRRNLFCFFLSTVVVPVCIWNLSEGNLDLKPFKINLFQQVYATHYDYEPAGVQSGPSFKKRLPKE